MKRTRRHTKKKTFKGQEDRWVFNVKSFKLPRSQYDNEEGYEREVDCKMARGWGK